MYLNMTIGLTYKWFDQEKIDTFFNMLAGKEQELYEGLLWIGLENALYQKEKNLRSALTELRREYAQENLNRYRKNKEYSFYRRDDDRTDIETHRGNFLGIFYL